MRRRIVVRNYSRHRARVDAICIRYNCWAEIFPRKDVAVIVID